MEKLNFKLILVIRDYKEIERINNFGCMWQSFNKFNKQQPY